MTEKHQTTSDGDASSKMPRDSALNKPVRSRPNSKAGSSYGGPNDKDERDHFNSNTISNDDCFEEGSSWNNARSVQSPTDCIASFPYRQSPPDKIRVIQEIFDSYNNLGHQQSLEQLDLALEDCVPVIMIESVRLGEETERWISLGRLLNQITITTGCSSLVIYCLKSYIAIPISVICLTSYSLYSISWQSDPCCPYKVENDATKLSILTANGCATATSPFNHKPPTVLVFNPESCSKNYFRHSIAVVTFVCASVKVYQLLRYGRL